MLIRETLRTSARNDMVDLTPLLNKALAGSGVKNGTAVVFCPHTTAAITINENADPDVVRDLKKTLSGIIPEHGDYRHAEGNSDAHLKSSLVGASETLIIEEGRWVLGTWQSVYFCEFDGPRERTVLIKLMADA